MNPVPTTMICIYEILTAIIGPQWMDGIPRKHPDTP